MVPDTLLSLLSRLGITYHGQAAHHESPITFSIRSRFAASMTTSRTLLSENLPADSVNTAAYGVASRLLTLRVFQHHRPSRIAPRPDAALSLPPAAARCNRWARRCPPISPALPAPV